MEPKFDYLVIWLAPFSERLCCESFESYDSVQCGLKFLKAMGVRYEIRKVKHLKF